MPFQSSLIRLLVQSHHVTELEDCELLDDDELAELLELLELLLLDDPLDQLDEDDVEMDDWLILCELLDVEIELELDD